MTWDTESGPACGHHAHGRFDLSIPTHRSPRRTVGGDTQVESSVRMMAAGRAAFCVPRHLFLSTIFPSASILDQPGLTGSPAYRGRVGQLLNWVRGWKDAAYRLSKRRILAVVRLDLI